MVLEYLMNFCVFLRISEEIRPITSSVPTISRLGEYYRKKIHLEYELWVVRHQWPHSVPFIRLLKQTQFLRILVCLPVFYQLRERTVQSIAQPVVDYSGLEPSFLRLAESLSLPNVKECPKFGDRLWNGCVWRCRYLCRCDSLH